MPGEHDIQKLVGELKKMKAAGAFKTFIDYIVFPRYRNISPDERIDFKFPLTVLVGQNGSGKTAVLQALYGAPGGTSVSRWWFETAVDPIVEPGPSSGHSRRSPDLPSERRSAFWYGYTHGKEERYVIKTRIRRANDPDYWEPSRPIAGYGMKTLPGEKRFDPIKMIPIYVNFKLNINAFDKCFYFHSELTLTGFAAYKSWRASVERSPSSRKQPRVQDYLRYRSRKLKRVLDGGIVLKHAGKFDLNRTVRELSAEEIGSINSIIGKNYTGGKVVEHRFFEGWGITVAFSTAERNYTDAFAGSGEGAVVRLVMEVEGATEGSLVLLDEPETSLHPGAQERMLAYLLERIKRRKLQVVISTHSPTLVQHLPREAVKVFSLNAEGMAEVIPDRPAEEAFHYIGHRYDASINIVVEDRLAKALVLAAIESKGPAFAKRFSVSFGPGGDSSIKKDMAVYSREEDGPVIFFDGDQIPFGLRLVPGANDESDLPADGESLVVVAQVEGLLRFRVFGPLGEQIVDKSESEVAGKEDEINSLRDSLKDLWASVNIPKVDRPKIIAAVASLVGLAEEIHVKSDRIAIGDRNPAFLMRLIERQAGFKVEFAMDSDMPDQDKSDIFVRYLDYYRRNAYYLPFPSPDEAIWDDGACRQLLDIDAPGTGDQRATSILSIAKYKQRFARLSELVDDVDAVHRLFVRRFSHIKGQRWEKLVALVTRIGDRNA